MKLFVLNRLDPSYDEITAMAMLAPTASAARILASDEPGQDEDSTEWLNPAKSTCTEVNLNKMGCVLFQTQDG